MAHAVERELIKASNYKARTKFDDRQDYLSSILNAVMKMSDSDFDDLSDEAAAWANSAVEAHNSKEEIPDFDEVEVPDDEGDGDDAETDDDVDGEEPASDGEDGDEESDEGSDDDPDSDDDSDADSDPDDDEDSEDDEDEGDDSEDEDEADEPVVKKKPAKAKAAPKKAPPPPAKKPVKAKPTKRAASDEDVVLDKWGCMEGSKNSQALAFFEKGATAREVKEELGGTYYNILKRCVESGHTIEKTGALIKLIHKNDKKGNAAKVAKSAKTTVVKKKK